MLIHVLDAPEARIVDEKPMIGRIRNNDISLVHRLIYMRCFRCLMRRMPALSPGGPTTQPGVCGSCRRKLSSLRKISAKISRKSSWRRKIGRLADVGRAARDSTAGSSSAGSSAGTGSSWGSQGVVSDLDHATAGQEARRTASAGEMFPASD